MLRAVAAARNTGWRWLNKWDEAHKTEVTVWANCLTWCLSKKREERRRCHCSVSDLGRTPGELSHMWLCGVNFSCTAGPWRHSANTSDYVCVHQHFADTTPFFVRLCRYSGCRPAAEFTSQAEFHCHCGCSSATGRSTPFSPHLRTFCEKLTIMSFTCGFQTLKRQKVNQPFWTGRYVS